MEENKDKDKKDFLDPITISTTSVLLFIGQQVIGGMISFFTFRFLKKWWENKDEKE